ncbi:MAG: TauD/TfdA family dioxygenase [Streptomycetaceae bacterium]|nr:TauD/TfdA family dioxygenase [Streptomycetaceae bacterium]
MTTATDSSAVAVTPVTGRIGALVTGVRLSGDLPPDVVAAVRAALLRHKVLFFRGQDHLTDTAQVAFTGLLGEPAAHPLGHEEQLVHPVASRYGGLADQWHTDLTFLPAFPAISVLRAVVLPECGGDTVWANTAAAYAELTPELRDFAARLRAVHTNAYDYAAPGRADESEAAAWYREMAAAFPLAAEHPVVAVHPETGERALLLGDFAQRLAGYPRARSDLLMRLLQEHITRLENTVRWSWRLGDVAVWDNRATQHRAVADFGDAPRVLHRTTVHGGTAVGVDGTPSVARTTA